ncbi:MAG TPA: ABC transporter substrate-binding protein [Candidatus Saccharimonadales bacterium]|nr:ABC transporter substrate-binding protein [Candidatus Saccharimonadales bacterium]
MTAGLQGLPYLQMLVAQQQGYYSKYKLDIKQVSVAGTSAIAAVESGQAQITVTLPENVIAADAAGGSLVIVGATVNQDLYSIWGGKGIESLNDLAGQKVAIFAPGNGTDIQLRWLLDNHGAGASKTTFVAAGGLAQRLAALQHDQVAGTILFPPYDVQAQKSGLTKLADMRTYVSGYPNEVIAVKRSFLDSNPEIVKGFLAALGEGVGFIQSQPDKALQMEVQATGEDMATDKTSFDSMKDTFSTKVDESGMEWTINAMKQYVTGLGPLPKVSDVYDASCLPAK